MGKNKKKGSKANVFKVAGAKSLKKSKAKAVNLGLKDDNLQTAALLQSKFKRKLGDPIKYQRKPGSRRYMEYTKQDLKECIAAIKAKRFTQQDASEYYNIPRSTIKNKLANLNCGVPGRVPVFSEEEEELFASRIWTLSDFGFPLTNYDIKMVVKDYLTSQNKTISEFRNNLPGKDWLKFFFDRHKDLCKHLETKYATIRTKMSTGVIADFIQYVSNETEDIPPENIYSYHELSLSDDHKRKVIVSRRGTKYPESVKNALKPRFTTMFCGNAVGDALPPYVIYKAGHRCSTWIHNGPKGARYNCTKHGWIDMVTFESWFLVHLLPYLKKKSGRKVLIGDSLSSHISGKVLAYCEKYDIRFICLPYKSSNILHPLDIAYYKPIKSLWTQIIMDWKLNQIAQAKSTILREDFPHLLNVALNTLTDIKQNIIVGFEKTGIYPINETEPICRLPRTAYQPPITFLRTESDSDLDLDEEESSCFQDVEQVEPKIEPIDDMECSNSSNRIDPNELYLVIVEDDVVFQIPIDDNENPLNLNVGDHVLVNRGNCHCPGRVFALSSVGAYVCCMKKWKSLWRWPKKVKEQFYSWEEVICMIGVPKLVEKGCFIVPELKESPRVDMTYFNISYDSD